NLLSPKKRAELKKYWSYEDHEIGSVMSNSFIELSISMTVKEAMKKVTSVAGQTDYISILYVVEKHKLVGYLKLKELIIARALQTIGDIMESRLITAYPQDDKEDVAQRLAEYGISSIPIIDSEHHIIGVATHDDLIDVISESKSEDYTKFAALSSAEIDFESEGIMASIKKRLPWLSILLGLSIVTSFILSLFEGQLSSSAGAMRLAASLAIYLPLILDMSGNTGTQSLAVMIRYLSSQHEKISRKEIYRHMRRELGTGVVQGIILGIVICGIILVTQWISKGAIDHLSWMTALVTSGSICIALIVSTVMGAFIPLFMDKVHIDPAVASGPFITTISDIITLTLYYSISLALLLPLYT
ncbi:MAG: magnesium transporter, partial [Candidatus Izemoplasmatales bacterium]|nr:magnesium transporter [Candidatus Izemoplasmatales bacterium]